MIRTWHVELGVVAAVELAIAAATGRPIELVGALAVVLSFAHAQVAERLAEAELAREEERVRRIYYAEENVRRAVECHRWSMRYLVGKEILWLWYFLARGAWSALVGVGLFLAYPIWRRWWRRRKPLRI